MRKAYQELFDGVHASERLKAEARNIMKNTTNKNVTRRIPAAALLAAVLVVALAGTALAAEYFGWLKLVRPVAPDELCNDNTRAGYQTEMVYDRIPADELSPEALAWISSVSEGGKHAYDSKSFDSWQDAENFLGLELANNVLLEGMGTKDSSFGFDGIYSAGPCLVMSEGLTGLTEVLSSYQDGEYVVSQTALLQFACPGQEEQPATISSRIEGMGGFRSEPYQTSGGLEAVFIIEDADADANVYASFIRDGVLFDMCVNGSNVEGAMEEMKLVLDAYE